jgi:hypothetical protein
VTFIIGCGFSFTFTGVGESILELDVGRAVGCDFGRLFEFENGEVLFRLSAPLLWSQTSV